MSASRRRRLVLFAGTLVSALAIAPLVAQGVKSFDYTFSAPVFGLATAWDGSLLVADAGAGIVRLHRGKGTLVAKLPQVSDVAPTGFDSMVAITGGSEDPAQITPLSRKLFKINRGKVSEFADLGAFEATVNPDGADINSNPFDVAPLLNGSILVADAGANALLVVDRAGHIDWVATLPSQLVSTANIKQLNGCPNGPAGICNLPPMIPAQPVATSIAVGFDGNYYMGELKGFPAPTGASRVWRIKRGTRHAQCGTSPDCEVIADGFTSIVDLSFGWDGTLRVVELDEASWFAVEVTHTPVGGTVNACRYRWWSGAWECDPEATGLTMPMATTVDFRGRVNVLVNALVPGGAGVITLP